MSNVLSAYSTAEQVEEKLNLAGASVQYFRSGTFTTPQRYTLSALSASGSFIPNLNDVISYDITLTGNLNLSNFAGLSAVDYIQDFYIIVRQDGIGSHSIGFDTAYKFQGGTTPTISLSANSVNIISGIVISPTEILCTGLSDWN